MGRIVITGSNGFIGRHLVKHFSANGNEVISVSRNVWDMKDPFPQGLLNSGDVVIHAAYSKFDSRTGDLNLSAAMSVKDACRMNNCRCIFFSTVSAHSNATSVYGKSKLEAEKIFDTTDVIVRPGLVLGNDGGLFKNILSFIKEKGIVPLVNGGNQPLQTIYIDDLVHAISKIVDDNRTGLFILCEKDPVTFKEFYKTLCSVFNLKAKFIPIPAFVLSVVIRMMKLVGITPPVDEENLKGLKSMVVVDSGGSLQSLAIKLKTWKESLEELRVSSSDT